MPQLLRIGPYVVYFWSNETNPLEPIHVHIAEGRPVADGTKIWITSTGKTLLCHNKSKIPDRLLSRLMKLVEANSTEIKQSWLDHFNEIKYYC